MWDSFLCCDSLSIVFESSGMDDSEPQPHHGFMHSSFPSYLDSVILGELQCSTKEGHKRVIEMWKQRQRLLSLFYTSLRSSGRRSRFFSSAAAPVSGSLSFRTQRPFAVASRRFAMPAMQSAVGLEQRRRNQRLQPFLRSPERWLTRSRMLKGRSSMPCR